MLRAVVVSVRMCVGERMHPMLQRLELVEHIVPVERAYVPRLRLRQASHRP